MEIRKATLKDIHEIMLVFEHARLFMQQNGNPSQWINGYPEETLIRTEIEDGYCYICKQQKEIVGTFCLHTNPDPTYTHIYEGKWLNDEPYGVIHRLASNGAYRGFAEKCIAWCSERVTNLRIDTHRENKIMQHILTKLGFLYCGTIFIKNGTERLAFQRKIK